MKKALTVLALILAVCTSVFASHRVTATLDAFTFQSFVQKNEGAKNAVKSKYGIGGGIGYNSNFDNGFTLGGELKVDAYMIKDQKSFADISLLAKAGYLAKSFEKLSLYGNMKAGLDIQTHNGETSAVFELGPELEAEMKLKENWDLFASCEVLFGFPKKGNARYSEFRLTPTIGAGYSF